ncbi:MAG: SUMF1/EgtB/PvdO family nonheme iron enzyme [Desulfosalsimonadaceae bacterium]
MPEIINILHLSDLHFGMEKTEKVPSTAVDQRNLTLREMIKTLKKIDKDWQPHVVAISGDIGWKGIKEDYNKAGEWLTNDLLPIWKLSPDKLVVCPGNHDIDRDEAIGLLPPPSSKEADEWLKLERLKKFALPFDAFVDFCKKMGVSSLGIGGMPGSPADYLTGTIDVLGMRFVGLNSSWFCRGDEDQNKLWLGRPLLKKMTANDQLLYMDDKETYDDSKLPVSIALFHHPREWLNKEEYYTYDKRQNTLEYLSFCSHIMLTGHVHARPLQPYQPYNRAWLVTGGAAYAANTYQNHFSILRVNTRERRFARIVYEFDPSKNQWRPDVDPTKAPSHDLKTPTSGKSSTLLIIPEKYKEWVAAQCRDMDITKLAGKSSVIRVGLPEIYIPLYTNPPETKSSKRKKEPEEIQDDRKPVDIEDLIPDSRVLVIRGRAGSGKTTLLKHVAHSMITEGNWKGLDGYLPVLVFLKDLKGFNAKGVSGNAETAENLLSFWAGKSGGFLDMDTIWAYCEAGKIVFFLDGLDEIDEGLRQLVAEAFHCLKIAHEQCKIVFSGRPHGVDDHMVRWFGKPIDILPLLMPQVEAFIHKWFEHVFENSKSHIAKTAPDLIGEIKSHPSITELIDSPLMLTAICLLYNDDRELPGQRAELYDRFITNLLYKRFGSEAQKVRNFLAELALNTHKKHSKIISRVDAVKILGQDYKKDADEAPIAYHSRLDQKFDEIEPACGLLKFEQGGYGFIHLTFQEFLTANALIASETGNHFNTIKTYWDKEWYIEVVRLYIGYLSIQNRTLANTIVGKILEEKDTLPYSRHLLAVRSFIDIHRDNRDEDTGKLAKKRLWEIIDSDAEPSVRAEAGELLGRLGDGRDFEVFIPIPDGIYETSTGKVKLKSFELAKFPVTNLWFGKFISDGGYKKPELWSKQGWKWVENKKAEEPEYWHDHQWNCPNHPVVGVCWYEADAFCRWLTQTRRDGFTYRLPDEKEWEAVAAGKQRREYPYGDKFDKARCNTDESNIEKTSAAGIFKAGDTPEGLSDLSGNVWEWSCSHWDTKKTQPDFKDYSEFPVVRGGSWSNFGNNAPCVLRNIDRPSGRGGNLGFRCSRTK